MDRQELFRNIMVMAAADGNLNQSEIEMLSTKARAWGIDDSEFAAAVHYALSPDCEVAVPPRHESRVEMLKELLKMMAADGRLAPAEKRIFAVVAVTMDFTQQQIDKLIDEALEEFHGEM